MFPAFGVTGVLALGAIALRIKTSKQVYGTTKVSWVVRFKDQVDLALGAC